MINGRLSQTPAADAALVGGHEGLTNYIGWLLAVTRTGLMTPEELRATTSR